MKWIDLKSLKDVRRGDILCNKGSGESYVVIDDGPIIAVRTLIVTNEQEWEKVVREEGE